MAMMNSDVKGNRCRGRPKLGWMDSVKRALGEKIISVEPGKQNELNRRWELIVRSELN